MRDVQALVRQFHQVIDQPTSPAEPKFRNSKLRASLILEEALETVVAIVGSEVAQGMTLEALRRAMEKPRSAGLDLVETIDGIVDTCVVCIGTAEDLGIELAPFWDEVMKTNLAKANGPVSTTGKRLKPPGWTPPDIGGILAEQIAEWRRTHSGGEG